MKGSFGSIQISRKQITLAGLILASYGILIFSRSSFPRICLFFNLTGVPCPFCGITRGIISTLRFDLVDAIQYHAFSPVILLSSFLIASTVMFVGKNVSIQLTYNRLALSSIVVLSSWGMKLVYVDKIYW